MKGSWHMHLANDICPVTARISHCMHKQHPPSHTLPYTYMLQPPVCIAPTTYITEIKRAVGKGEPQLVVGVL